jgi:hypothetical protein
MTKQLISISLGLVFLATWAFIGMPIEFLTTTSDTLADITLVVLFLFLFSLLFIQIKRLDRSTFKRVAFWVLGLLSVPYTYVGLSMILFASFAHRPIWQDIKIYTNNEGEKLISQRLEVSGSLHEHRDRKIIADYGTFRISFNCNAKNLTGTWTEYTIETNTTRIINFDNKTSGIY